MIAQLHALDWAIFGAMALAILLIACRTQRYMRSVSDFLAAGRTARRYLLTVTSGGAGHAAVRIVGTFEMVYKSGFASTWWPLLTPVGTLTNLTGFVIYRFRETRALTLAQFLEIRYSRNLRLFAGVLMFISGVLNMGIFPAVGARFFVYFCGLPQAIHIGRVQVSTLALITFVLVAIAVYLTLGGQITLLFTDFFEGMTTQFAFLAVLAFLFWAFDWHTITQTLVTAPAGASLLNPYHSGASGAGHTREFDVWFFVIAAATQLYSTMAWQGTSGFNSAPATPHESRMGRLLGQWREVSFALMITLMPIAAYVVLHHPDFAAPAHAVQQQLARIPNHEVQSQMIVPIALAQMLPIGLKGITCAIMFYGFLGNLDTYMHSFGSIFIQDIILPFRKTPFSPEAHIRLLRWSIAGVAVFISLFSVFYTPTEFIVMFQIGTAAVYLAGAGAIIIGGLYWKRGTTTGAWAAMIAGAIFMLASILLRQVDAHRTTPLLHFAQPDPQIVSVIAMGLSSATYILVSLLTCRVPFNLKRMLHRDTKPLIPHPTIHKRKGWLPRMNWHSDFTPGDKALASCNAGWALFWFLAAWSTTIGFYLFGHDFSDRGWSRLWQYKCYLAGIIGVVMTIWISIGGIRDLRYMLHMLRTMPRDKRDDGMVVDHHNLDETKPPSSASAKETAHAEYAH